MATYIDRFVRKENTVKVEFGQTTDHALIRSTVTDPDSHEADVHALFIHYMTVEAVEALIDDGRDAYSKMEEWNQARTDDEAT